MAPAWNPGIAAPPLLPLRCIVRACHVTRCGVLQYVAVCCSVNVLQCVLQCVIAMYCSSTFVAPLHGESVPCHMLQYVAVGSSVFQCQRVAICCSMLQCVMAVCCSVSLRCAAVALLPLCCFVKDCHVTRCSVLQCVAVCCSVLQCQHVGVCCSVMSSVLQFHFCRCVASWKLAMSHVAACCSVLQIAAVSTRCNGMQSVVNVLQCLFTSVALLLCELLPSHTL